MTMKFLDGNLAKLISSVKTRGLAIHHIHYTLTKSKLVYYEREAVKNPSLFLSSVHTGIQRLRGRNPAR